jgi:hypothetical protein
MEDGPIWLWQKNVYEWLQASAAVTELTGGRVYRQAPLGAAHPYLLLDGPEAEEEPLLSAQGRRLKMTVRAASVRPGIQEILALLEAARLAVHGKLHAVAGHYPMEVRYGGQRASRLDVDRWQGEAWFLGALDPNV